jgi:hypothetical protein
MCITCMRAGVSLSGNVTVLCTFYVAMLTVPTNISRLCRSSFLKACHRYVETRNKSLFQS